jgi:hypothetical protein
MALRSLVAALAIALAGLVSVPVVSSAAPTSAQLLAHPCTRTSSGTCIQGGQFCPQASYGQSGWDARGRRYVCRGDHTHPHWMKPQHH